MCQAIQHKRPRTAAETCRLARRTISNDAARITGRHAFGIPQDLPFEVEDDHEEFFWNGTVKTPWAIQASLLIQKGGSAFAEPCSDYYDILLNRLEKGADVAALDKAEQLLNKLQGGLLYRRRKTLEQMDGFRIRAEGVVFEVCDRSLCSFLEDTLRAGLSVADIEAILPFRCIDEAEHGKCVAVAATMAAILTLADEQGTLVFKTQDVYDDLSTPSAKLQEERHQRQAEADRQADAYRKQLGAMAHESMPEQQLSRADNCGLHLRLDNTETGEGLYGRFRCGSWTGCQHCREMNKRVWLLHTSNIFRDCQELHVGTVAEDDFDTIRVSITRRGGKYRRILQSGGVCTVFADVPFKGSCQVGTDEAIERLQYAVEHIPQSNPGAKFYPVTGSREWAIPRRKTKRFNRVSPPSRMNVCEFQVYASNIVGASVHMNESPKASTAGLEGASVSYMLPAELRGIETVYQNIDHDQSMARQRPAGNLTVSSDVKMRWSECTPEPDLIQGDRFQRTSAGFGGDSVAPRPGFDVDLDS